MDEDGFVGIKLPCEKCGLETELTDVRFHPNGTIRRIGICPACSHLTTQDFGHLVLFYAALMHAEEKEEPKDEKELAWTLHTPGLH